MPPLNKPWGFGALLLALLLLATFGLGYCRGRVDAINPPPSIPSR